MQASLNFLSPEKKSVLRTGFVFAYVQTLLFAVFVVVTFCSGMLIGLRMMLNETKKNIELQTAGNNRDAAAVTEEIAAVNAYLTREKTYADGFTEWSALITELTDAVPPGVQVSQIQFSEGGQVEITGRALERASVLAMEANLKASPSFKDVTAPLSNILTQYDVSFQFSLLMVDPPKMPQAEVAQPTRRRSR